MLKPFPILFSLSTFIHCRAILALESLLLPDRWKLRLCLLLLKSLFLMKTQLLGRFTTFSISIAFLYFLELPGKSDFLFYALRPCRGKSGPWHGGSHPGRDECKANQLPSSTITSQHCLPAQRPMQGFSLSTPLLQWFQKFHINLSYTCII